MLIIAGERLKAQTMLDSSLHLLIVAKQIIAGERLKGPEKK
jgi:hypothetical protein